MVKAFQDMYDEGVMSGKTEGIIEGKTEGEDLLGRLISLLLDEGRVQDARKAATDAKARKRMYKKYGIQ